MKKRWVRVGIEGRFLKKKALMNQKYKDEIFRIVFDNKKDLLQLYNAINGTNYLDEGELKVNTLKDAILIGVKNDLSFIIGQTLNLYEQQSSVNPNMPLRGVIYFAELFSAYIQEEDLHIYGSKLIKLPLPQYVVFYNGTTDQPARKELKLSDAFELQGKEGCLECKAIMININLEHNKELLDSCQKLKEYSQFVDIVRRHLSKSKFKDRAISNAISECIKKDILVEILERNRAVIMNILSKEYFEKNYWRLERAAVRTEAREEGLMDGFTEGFSKGEIEGEIKGEIKGRAEGIRAFILDNLEEGVSIDKIIEKLQKRFSLNEKQAKEYIKNMSILLSNNKK